MKIAFLGGGNFGRHLADLLVTAGHDVAVGLRDETRAPAHARYRVVSLEQAAAHGEIVVIAVLYQACAEVLPPLAAHLAGKIVVDATNAVGDDWSPLPLPGAGSAAHEIARLIPAARLVKCFNTVFADLMTRERLDRDGHRVTAFIAGDDDEANAIVATVASQAGFGPIVAGALDNARYLEAMAHLNIQLAIGRGGGTDAGFIYHQGRRR
jgi:predicted dinucleotide-binding enzyme